jgi:lactobin A/cerein 7B family class IIb bacteriocin
MMRTLSAIEVKEVNGGLVWALAAAFAVGYAAGYAEGKYTKWRNSVKEPVIDGWTRAG